MTIRSTNTTIRIAAIIMIAIGIIAIAVALLTPIEDASHAGASGDANQSALASATTSDLPSLNDFDVVFSKSLRESAGSASTQPTSASAGGVQLVGTIGDQIALIRNGGETEAKSVGERIDGAELIAVRNGEVDMRTADGVVTLRKTADAPQPEFIHTSPKP